MQVTLRRRQTSAVFQPAQVYFAFPSGRFRYDCVSCGAKCCRGYGYGVGLDGTARKHIESRPSLRFFVEQSSDGATVRSSIRNCPPACFFLDADGLCGVQRDLGYDSKPETCRLFPFNNLRVVGDFLVAAPHASLCPLETVPVGEWSSMSDHASLLAAYAAFGIEAKVPIVRAMGSDPSALVALERAIVTLAERSHASFQDFLQCQVRLSADFLKSDAEHDISGDIHALEGRLHEVLQVPGSLRHADLADHRHVLNACTPFLRSLLVFPEMERVQTFGVVRVPRVLLALFWLTVLAIDAGMTSITFQTVSRLFSDHLPLLLTLSYLDERVNWSSGEILDFRFEGGRDWHRRYLVIVKYLARADAAKPAFAEVLMDSLPSDGIERIAFLRKLAKRLAGRIDGATDAGRTAVFRPRPALQRWAARRLDADFLLTLIERGDKRANESPRRRAPP